MLESPKLLTLCKHQPVRTINATQPCQSLLYSLRTPSPPWPPLRFSLEGSFEDTDPPRDQPLQWPTIAVGSGPKSHIYNLTLVASPAPQISLPVILLDRRLCQKLIAFPHLSQNSLPIPTDPLDIQIMAKTSNYPRPELQLLPFYNIHQDGSLLLKYLPH